MNLRSLALAALLALPLTMPAVADEFAGTGQPSFTGIEGRLVYGVLKYDVSFNGNGPKTREQSAQKFLGSLIDKKFGNKEGNYMVTLDVVIDGKTVMTEPLISANWEEKKKFLFIRSSTSESLVVNRAGVLLDGLVVDNRTNRLTLSITALHSSSSSVDMSLFKQLSDLSQSAAISAFTPGTEVVSKALEPITAILEDILKRYKREEIVERNVGVFTLLDEGLPNELRYSNGQLTVNIFLQTKNSQMPRNFDTAAQTFKPDTSPKSVLANVQSGAGVARETVLDIMMQDNDPANAGLRKFLEAVIRPDPEDSDFTKPVRHHCQALMSRLDSLVTTRDASLVYWAILRTHGGEIRKYSDGKSCADPALSESLVRWGLDPGPEWAP